MGDPAELNFIKLKKWLGQAGAPKADLDKCVDKDALLVLLPQYKDAGMAAAASSGSSKKNATAAAKPVSQGLTL